MCKVSLLLQQASRAQPLRSLGGPLTQVGSSCGAPGPSLGLRAGPALPRTAQAAGRWTRGRGGGAERPGLCGAGAAAFVSGRAPPGGRLLQRSPRRGAIPGPLSPAAKELRKSNLFPDFGGAPFVPRALCNCCSSRGQCEGLYGAKKSRRWAAPAPAARPLLRLPSRCGNSPGKFFSQ